MTAGRARWGLVALFAVAAVVATLPAVGALRSEFMADGAPGYGEAASGDHLQTTYRFWLVGHQLERGEQPRGSTRTASSRSWSRRPSSAAGPTGSRSGRSTPSSARSSRGTCFCSRSPSPRASSPTSGCGSSIFLRRPPRSAAWRSSSRRTGCSRAAATCSAGSPCSSRSRSGPTSARAGLRPAARHICGARSRRRPSSRSRSPASSTSPSACSRSSPPTRRSASRGRPRSGPGEERWPPPPRGWSRRRSSSPARRSRRGGASPRSPTTRPSPLDVLSRWRLHGPERFVYLGWLLPVLAVVGLVLLARRRRGLAILLGLAALLPALLALGTNLPLYETLRDVFPPLRYPRVPGRFLPLANLALAALAAVAVGGGSRALPGAAPRGRRRGAPRARRRRPARLPAARERGRPGQRRLRRARRLGPGPRPRAPDLPARHGPVRERVPVLHPAGAEGAADRVRARAGGGLRLHRAVQPARLRRLAPRRPGGAGGARHPLDPLARRALPAVGDAGRVARERGAPARGARDRRRRPGGLPVGARAGRRAARP